MKRLLPLLFLLTLAGCDDETVDTTAATPATPETPAAAQPQAAGQPQAATLVEPGRSCADFQFYKNGQNLGSSATVDPILLATADQSDIEVYDPAADIGVAGAMSVRIKGRLNITTDAPHPKFEIAYIAGGDTPLRLEVYGADGAVLETQYLLTDPANAVLTQTVEEANGIKSMSLSEGGGQASLSRVCILQ
jgi:hypothetical protein